jgi:hypothetical protein
MTLTPTMRDALALLAQEPFVYTAAGWHAAANDGAIRFSTQTMAALAGRGFVKFRNRGKRNASIAITPKGREALQKEPA